MEKGNMTEDAKTMMQKMICNDVLIAIRRIIQSVDLHSRYLVRHFGLTGPQLIILQEISKRKEVSISAIAKAVSLGQPTVTGILERLESRGLITRRRSEEDKRKVFIAITEGCRKLMEKTPPPMQEHFTNAFNCLQDWEQSMILASLQRIVKLMGVKTIAAEPILMEADPISEESEKLFF
jgi:DNA-binding MarR family transcriptional regulator